MEYLKSFTLFSIGALGYGIIELLFRGYTHISMGVLGGICMLFISIIDSYRKSLTSAIFCAVVCGIFITAMEALMGYFLNIRLGLNIWDYSKVGLDLNGQICLKFSLVWVLLSFFTMQINSLISKRVFLESKNILKST